jgi:hypothetical protein
MPKNKGAIVAIHGVGTPAVGDIITDLSVLTKNTFYTRSDVVSQGTKFAAQTCEDASSPDLFEVNWSDIKRPPRSIMGVAEWIVSLSFAFSHANLSWTGIRLLTGRVHPIMFEAIFLWVIYPLLLGLMHANLSSYALVVADSAVIGIAVLTLRVNLEDHDSSTDRGNHCRYRPCIVGHHFKHLAREARAGEYRCRSYIWMGANCGRCVARACRHRSHNTWSLPSDNPLRRTGAAGICLLADSNAVGAWQSPLGNNLEHCRSAEESVRTRSEVASVVRK